jgi:hypothetical protein
LRDSFLSNRRSSQRCFTWDALGGIAISSNLSIQRTISCSSAGVRVWSYVWASERVLRPFRRAWTVLRGTPYLAAARRIEWADVVLCTSSIASRMRIALVSFARALILGIGCCRVVVVLRVLAPLFMYRKHEQPPLLVTSQTRPRYTGTAPSSLEISKEFFSWVLASAGEHV